MAKRKIYNFSVSESSTSAHKKHNESYLDFQPIELIAELRNIINFSNDFDKTKKQTNALPSRKKYSLKKDFRVKGNKILDRLAIIVLNIDYSPNNTNYTILQNSNHNLLTSTPNATSSSQTNKLKIKDEQNHRQSSNINGNLASNKSYIEEAEINQQNKNKFNSHNKTDTLIVQTYSDEFTNKEKMHDNSCSQEQIIEVIENEQILTTAEDINFSQNSQTTVKDSNLHSIYKQENNKPTFLDASKQLITDFQTQINNLKEAVKEIELNSNIITNRIIENNQITYAKVASVVRSSNSNFEHVYDQNNKLIETAISNINNFDKLEENINLRLNNILSSINNQNKNVDEVPVYTNKNFKLYSEMVKQPPAIIIFPNQGQTMDDLKERLEKIKTNVSPIKILYGDQVIKIYFKTIEDRKYNEEILIANKINIKQQNTSKIKLIIFNVPDNIEDTELVNIIHDNSDRTFPKDNIIIVDRRCSKKFKGFKHVSIKVPVQAATLLVEKSYLFSGFKKYLVKKFLYVQKCQICQSLKHNTQNCTSRYSFCGYCSFIHPKNHLCLSKTPKCINCMTSGITKEIYHPTYSLKCPTYLSFIKNKFNGQK